MKPAYLGGVRGYQSAVYRPGLGWEGVQVRRHAGHQPAVFKKNRTMHVRPVTVARRRRPGVKTKMAIIATIAAVAGLLTLVLTGAAQL